jgi:hypothetical protein
LSRHRSFPCVDHSLAIYCTKDYGPWFGTELALLDEPFNKPNACRSWSCLSTKIDVYKIPVNTDGINMLTNKKSLKNEKGYEESEFTIKEIEVWGVTFLE